MSTNEISKYQLDFSLDDEIVMLIDANTNAKLGRAQTNVLKCIALIAGGTPMRTSCKLTGIPRATLQSWRRPQKSQKYFTITIEFKRRDFYIIPEAWHRIQNMAWSSRT